MSGTLSQDPAAVNAKKDGARIDPKAARRMQVTVVGGKLFAGKSESGRRWLVVSLKNESRLLQAVQEPKCKRPRATPQSRRSQLAAKQEAGRCLAMVLEGPMLWLGRRTLALGPVGEASNANSPREADSPKFMKTDPFCEFFFSIFSLQASQSIR
jgi:hypothetical protein